MKAQARPLVRRQEGGERCARDVHAAVSSVLAGCATKERTRARSLAYAAYSNVAVLACSVTDPLLRPPSAQAGTSGKGKEAVTESLSLDDVRPEEDKIHVNLATEGITDQLTSESFANSVHASSSGLVRRGGDAAKRPEMREMRHPDRTEAVEDVVHGGGVGLQGGGESGASRSSVWSGKQSIHESADDSQVRRREGAW